MNYRHAFHAGNFADVFKHAVLASVLRYLTQKEAAFRVIDTHSGTGLYDLAGVEAERTGEWRSGIGRLLERDLQPALAGFLAPYLDVLAMVRGYAGPAAYPGSPLIAQNLCRADDRMIFVEKHPVDVGLLRQAIGRDRRAKVLELDGWTALSANIPPKERRGLVLIDPPFEVPDEFERMGKELVRAWKKWPTGLFMLWYPLKNPDQTRLFMRALAETGIPKMLRLELMARRETVGGPLAGSGMIVINPPWTLEGELRTALPGLRDLLGVDPGASWMCDWIARE
jgi:23S rRNA (adenine2030-N6)-methyltransferase